MKLIKLSNGDEYTVCSEVSELEKFQTAHTNNLLKEGLYFNAWPTEVSDVYQAGPIKLWLYKSKNVNAVSPLYCVTWRDINIYFTIDEFEQQYRSSSYYSKNSTYVMYDTIKDSKSIQRLSGNSDVILHSEICDMMSPIKSLSSALESYSFYYSSYNKAVDKTFEKIFNKVENSIQKRKDIKINQYQPKFFIRRFELNSNIPDVEEFMYDISYHLTIMRALWVKQNRKVLAEDEKQKAESLGISVKDYKEHLQEKLLEKKSVVRVSAVIKAAPALIKFRDNLNLFIDKLGNDEKFNYKDVNELRVLLKNADREILNLRHLGKF